jgi:hypothetical protein
MAEHYASKMRAGTNAVLPRYSEKEALISVFLSIPDDLAQPVMMLRRIGLFFPVMPSLSVPGWYRRRRRSPSPAKSRYSSFFAA